MVRDVDRSSSRWPAVVAERHEGYRSAVEPTPGRLAAVCVSKRPDELNNVIENIRRQSRAPDEFIFVTNSADFSRAEVAHALAGLDGVVTRTHLVTSDPTLTLGECLNLGLDLADGRFIAKFDDDDRYGADYLADALRAHAVSHAAIVGKHTHYALLERDQRLVMRFPGREFAFSAHLAGGTLLFDRELTGDIRFEPISIGEDRALIRACHRRGLSSFSGDRFNYLQVRTGENTWSVPDEIYLRDALEVGHGSDLPSVER